MSSFREINLHEILFLDIETVPLYENYSDTPENVRKLWDKKAALLSRQESDTPDVLYKRAGIYSEFGKIICISVGFFDKSKKEFRIKSFYGEDENKLLSEFISMLTSPSAKVLFKYFCGHNAKEFDVPYICRRALINGLRLPESLQLYSKKPWETNILDTMDLWRFGDVKNYTSLELLCEVLNIPTPKNDIDGSMVAEVYWIEKDIERIVSYCQKDVVAVAQIFLRFREEPLMNEEIVNIV